MNGGGNEKRSSECDVLPKGWIREEVMRKGGLSAGKFDVYYYPPTGKKVRSKPELIKVLGDTFDLSCFDYSSGTMHSTLIKPRGKPKANKEKATSEHSLDVSRAKDSDDDGGYGVERKKEKKKIVSDSDSDSEGEKKKKDKGRERERERSKKHKRDKERKREGGDLFKAEGHSSKKRDEAPKKKSKPKYFRDINPEKILGVTSDLGEVHFYIKWEGGKTEPALVTAKEAYQNIPQMCLKFYESHLVWDKKETKKAETKEKSMEKVLQKSMEKVLERVVRRESVESRSSETSKSEVKERPSSSQGKEEETANQVPAKSEQVAVKPAV